MNKPISPIENKSIEGFNMSTRTPYDHLFEFVPPESEVSEVTSIIGDSQIVPIKPYEKK